MKRIRTAGGSAAGGVMIALALLAGPAVSREAAESSRPSAPIRIVATGGIGAGILRDSAAGRLGTVSGGPILELGLGAEFLGFFDLGFGGFAQHLNGRDPAAGAAAGDGPSGGLWPLAIFVQAGVQAPVPVGKRGGVFPARLVFHAGRFAVSADRPMAGKWFYRPEARLRIAPGIFAGLAYTFYCDCSDYRSAIALTLSARLMD